MVREISEPAVSRPDRSLFPFAVIGALVLALPLSACGRKGPLDPPPGGYMLDNMSNRTTAVTRKGDVREKQEPSGYDEDGRPIAPTGSRKKLPADWLID
jgi:predicted small lipoprotein YifL